MRLVIDTNVLLSALLSAASPTSALLTAWRRGRFHLLIAEEQIEELRRATRYPKIRERLRPALAGELVNELRELAVMVSPLPCEDASPDPLDNFMLAIAQGGMADYLVSGDRRGLLILGSFGPCHIVTPGRMLEVLRA
jgi:hypothetical protein